MHDVEAVSRQREIVSLHERSTLELLADHNIAADGDALTGEDGIDGVQLLAKAEIPRLDDVRNIGIDGARSCQPSRPRRRRGIPAGPVKMHQRIPQQFRGSRYRPIRQQARAAYGKEAVATDFLRLDVGRHSARIADRDIGIPGAQVEHPIGPDDLQRDVRMRLAPVGKPGNQPAAGKCVRAGHAQPLSLHALRDRCNCCGKCIEAVSHHRKQLFARGRERQRSRAPPKQGTSADVLELANLMADGRRRHAQLVRGRFEAHMPRGGLEGP